MITQEDVELARKAPWLKSPRVDDTSPENSALFTIGTIIEARVREASRPLREVVDDMARRFAPWGLDSRLAETAYRYVHCWG
ncbi:MULTISPECIES: hypothetical protein [Chromohalobacter]|jgi:hypothetical protein|uniref:Uncharacterized protein n=1 Tax=Chromohalobacter israelensis (strain ATCC BAA-138 / DSM 3043 / CIP 106854 / NCIMB 13768 / 1H11) TaxID=290398 RepID=Q1QYJ9_CHRI1|nr:MULTISPECIES: hypothetical protein [Chromohalobacter]ABE58459.1 hypothetical protein Csal_1103 [Chromohalobacter salexigens DSM 3043]MDF9432894.1 hypothetical protein [Chromohalobacter israelensis]MDO0944531.1 hypothetical protein [Chromohalobacter salexigens]NWO55127.1 hypothetical protein [Chromohalobacter salexigens]PWW34612.1 hypothetical protein DFO74_11934 [Chromohalobacter salexigens]